MESAKNRLRKVFRNAEFDAALIVNTDNDDSNFTYLTGYAPGWYSGCALVADRDGMRLFANRLVCGTAKRNRPKELEVVPIDSKDQMAAALKMEIGRRTVGVNKGFVPYAQYLSIRKMLKDVDVVDLNRAFRKARSIKDHDEQARIRTAVRITKRSIDSVKSGLTIGMSELEVSNLIDAHFREAGAINAFDSIVAYGPDTAMPHYAPQASKRLKENSIVLMDVGARYKNYCGDITRTFFYKPDRSSSRYRKLKEMYDVVERAQQIALDRMKPGADGAAADKAARDYIDRYRNGIYRGRFIHTLGHSIGIDVHDGARLYYKAKYRLENGMVFSDEPGIYMPGIGGVRIEDDVVIGRNPHFA